MAAKILAVRICSAVKNPELMPGDHTLLRDMYFQTNLKGFFKRMQEFKIPYAVVSRKYGICEEGPHNIMYADIEELDEPAFIELLKSQAPKYRDTTFLYYFHRPATHQKWVEILRNLGLHVITIQRLGGFAPWQQVNEKLIIQDKNTSKAPIEGV